ncbi:MAG: citrate synthase [Acidimicrobiia bacterium]|nr:citrate synthase [Acidimicrobiia bacterium]
MTDRLTAVEAAARLGVKRETLYAYVSRGVLGREMAIDGRTSLFDAREIDALRRQSRRTARGELTTVVASAITRLDETGHSYRGTRVADLVGADRDFEEVADLLWEGSGDWPVSVESTVAAVQAALPETSPGLDRLRASVAALSAGDPLRHDLSPVGVAAAGRRSLTAMVDGLPRRRRGRDSGRLADRLWPRITRQPATDEHRRCLNAALVTLADHGLAASTFAVRVAASVRADAYSALTAGLGALGGQLHGAASAGVHRMLVRADEEASAEVAVGEILRRGERIPGCGHPIYRDVDPREEVLGRLIRDAWSGDPRVEIVDAVSTLGAERSGRAPNIDMAIGALTWLADTDTEAGEVIFAVARTAGWLAHAIEELGEKPARFRPEARYVGP